MTELDERTLREMDAGKRRLAKVRAWNKAEEVETGLIRKLRGKPIQIDVSPRYDDEQHTWIMRVRLWKTDVPFEPFLDVEEDIETFPSPTLQTQIMLVTG
jgi:hypothetical protein